MTQIESLQRRNLVFGLLAILLFAYIVFRPSETSAVTSEAWPALFPEVKAADVRTVLLERTQGDEQETLRIQREGEAGWALASAHGYPASPDKVNRFLESLQGSRRKKFVTERAETFADYAGTDGWLHVTVLGEGGKSLADFHLGKSAGWPDSFVRLAEEGKPVVVRAYNLSATDVKLSTESWTEARLWPGLTMPDVARVDVHQRDEKAILSFLREERPVAPRDGEPADAQPQTEQVWKMAAPKQAEPEKNEVEDLVRTFSGMRFASIAARSTGDAENEHFGFAEPAYRVSVFGAQPAGGGEAPKFVLLVGNAVPTADEGESSGRLYVRRGDDEWVFEVTAASIGAFRQTPDEYLPPPPAPEEPAVPEVPAPGGDAHGSPDDGAAPDAPVPPGDQPPLPPEEPDEPEAPKEE